MDGKVVGSVIPRGARDIDVHRGDLFLRESRFDNVFPFPFMNLAGVAVLDTCEHIEHGAILEDFLAHILIEGRREVAFAKTIARLDVHASTAEGAGNRLHEGQSVQ